MTTEYTYDETRRTAEIGGITFSWHEAGEGEPLVLLHGSGPGVSAWSNFRYNLPVFARRFRTIMPDMPGFGATELPKLDEFYATLAARRIAHLMDHLGIESALFTGNSMGGAVVAELAALHPQRVRRMALIGSGGLSVGIFGTDPSEGFLRLFEFLDDPTRERMIGWVKTMVYDHRLITDELIDERMKNALSEGVIPRMKAIFGAMFNPALRQGVPPLWTRSGTIKTPTLLLWGRDDRMLPYDHAHLANRLLPEVELHSFSHCGHWVQIERKTEFERVSTEFHTR
ncbi:alpha/beta fold hydrolase [Agrobacterium rhizogenes]|uniref:Hydrolase n=1 Tax=Rhizobium rhizogenes NBRC 13257 TaxID=1220581 RepID=A0AA87U7R2_RHIRH|nr:alpha/beta fold hydrolase [Rhizobium rhizogenes]NTG65111.1 alpha/beta fold hydrolase [Rhizobium rhizogenes]NTG71562.1 alpha/beta fold hydrolase [Rhizobium rhizogenes]NTG84461.1 alpha/beta fold hydrolase [Rhizobium rhizogenes]NTG90855.1 alpha/beta fold hydrolase [Rhizobium rhizogenes]NTH29489.1 alpha/beta fold hydrolase [Rhizobium rhizogenes]